MTPDEPHSPPFTSVSEMLTDALRRSILAGELAEGECLRQQAIARRYRVSEVMVREAFRRLEAEGLVEAEPRRGVRVSRLSVEEIAELYELRILLEELITRHAVPNCTAEDLASAETVLKDMDREKDPVRWLSLNRDFHLCLYRASHRERLLKFASHLRVIVERYLRLSLGILKGFDIAQREHRAILAAYRAGNAELAARHVGAHLRRTADFIVTFLKARDRADGALIRQARPSGVIARRGQRPEYTSDTGRLERTLRRVRAPARSREDRTGSSGGRGGRRESH